MGAVTCDSSAPACAETDAGVPDGTACGKGQVCFAGACASCTEGAACVPRDPCHAGVLNCASGQPLCTDTLQPGPDGVSCGVDLLCRSGSCGPGDGVDGSQTIVGTQRLDDIASSCTGAAGTDALDCASTAGFARGQQLLVHQTVGASAGTYEEATVLAVASATSLSLAAPLRHAYVAGAQALILRRYTDLSVSIGATLTARPWDGRTGGIVAFKARGAVHVDGRLSAAGLGYRGGTAQASTSDYAYNQQGESTAGAGPLRAPGNGAPNASGGGSGCGQGSGAGGGFGTAGTDGAFTAGTPVSGCISGCAPALGQGGATAGVADLSSAVFGGGGGASGSHDDQGRNGAAGGAGGGLVYIHAGTIEVAGTVDAGGAPGVNGYFTAPVNQPMGGGGGGAGGAVRFVAGSIRISGTVKALGGGGGAHATAGTCSPSGDGGAGGDGRIFLSSPTIAGTTQPPAFTATTP